MSSMRQNTVVGLFTLATAVVLVGLVFIFGGGGGLFATTYDLQVHFKDGVVGVQDGQGVTMYGKRIGETAAVEFYKDAKGVERPEKGVVVHVDVEGQYALPKTAKVFVATSLIGLGRPAIQLVVEDPLDTSRLPTDGSAVIPGEMIRNIDQLLPPDMQATLMKATNDIGELAAALVPAAKNLSRLLEERNIQDVDVQKFTANLDTLAQRFDASLKNLNAIIGDEQNQANFKAALANVRRVSESAITLADNAAAISEEGKQTIKEMTALMRRLTATADHVSAVLQQMEGTLAQINQGQGTFGLLLNDNRLYEELVLSAKRLTKALDDFREVADMTKQGKLRIKAF